MRWCSARCCLKGNGLSELIHFETPSPNWNERQLPISMVVLHYTGMQSADEALARLCDEAAQVSAHYLIEEDGTVHRLVREDRRAWHAGKSYWGGQTDMNSASIGIELDQYGDAPFESAQIDALLTLLDGIVRDIKPRLHLDHVVVPNLSRLTAAALACATTSRSVLGPWYGLKTCKAYGGTRMSFRESRTVCGKTFRFVKWLQKTTQPTVKERGWRLDQALRARAVDQPGCGL